MSLLIAVQKDQFAILVTDTLVVDDDDRPIMFQPKVWPLPPLNMVIAVTGTAELGSLWYGWLMSAPGPRDIDSLHERTPEMLRAIRAGFEARHGRPLGRTTVYHFGFPTESEQIVRYTYRSDDDFAGERFQGRELLAKPTPPGTDITEPENRDEFIALAARLRDENDRLLGKGGVPSGGELFATAIENWKIESARWHRFDSYDDDLAAMGEQ